MLLCKKSNLYIGYEDIACDFNLWGEYFDPIREISESKFEEMNYEDKIEMMVDIMGLPALRSDADDIAKGQFLMFFNFD